LEVEEREENFGERMAGLAFPERARPATPRRRKESRSQLFSDAVREYIARHAPEKVTEGMDRVCAEVGHPADKFVSSAARRVLDRNEWWFRKAKFGGRIYRRLQDLVRDSDARLSWC